MSDRPFDSLIKDEPVPDFSSLIPETEEIQKASKDTTADVNLASEWAKTEPSTSKADSVGIDTEHSQNESSGTLLDRSIGSMNATTPGGIAVATTTDITNSAKPITPSTKSDDVTNIKTDGSTSVKSDTTASIKSDGVTSAKSDTATSVKSDGIASVKSDTATSIKSDSATSIKSDSIASVKSDTATSIKSDTATSIKPDDATSIKSDSATSVKSESATSIKSKSIDDTVTSSGDGIPKETTAATLLSKDESTGTDTAISDNKQQDFKVNLNEKETTVPVPVDPKMDLQQQIDLLKEQELLLGETLFAIHAEEEIAKKNSEPKATKRNISYPIQLSVRDKDRIKVSLKKLSIKDVDLLENVVARVDAKRSTTGACGSWRSCRLTCDEKVLKCFRRGKEEKYIPLCIVREVLLFERCPSRWVSLKEFEFYRAESICDRFESLDVGKIAIKTDEGVLYVKPESCNKFLLYLRNRLSKSVFHFIK